MSNKVFIEVEAPEAIWMRGECAVSEEGLMRYESKFCRAGLSPKPIHLGPVVTLVVMNGAKEMERRSVTIGVRSNGILFLQSYREATSELETKGIPPSAPLKEE